MLTSQYGNLRQSWNGNETVLTTGNVANLKQLATLTVDTPPSTLGLYNPIYAQPLYVAGITVNSAYQSNCNNLTVNRQPACNMLIAVTGYGSIWAWNADTGQAIFSRTALWNDCGPGSSVAQNTDGGAGTAPFGGVLSTPVIDPGLTPPAMFLTSLCKNSSSRVSWYLHEIDLTNNLQDVAGSNSPVQLGGTAPASDDADDEVNTTVPFYAFSASQRSALLEVRNPYATPNPVIYFSFGTALSETYTGAPGDNPSKYHGWVFAYTVTGTGNQLTRVPNFPFVTTAKGPTNNTDSPACAQDCQLPSTNSLSVNCVASGYQNSPNWCGHGGGTWMSTRGPAANTLGAGNSQVAWVYYGVGNGGFQTNGRNYGQSLIDFRLSQASGADSTPYQSFTPHGGPPGCSPTGTVRCQPALQPQLGRGCPNELGGNCQYTVETQNANDWDMATSGILLFDDSSGNHRLVTIDKAGYGHVITQGQLCDPSLCSAGGQEFTPGDTGDWPFGALQKNLCDALGRMYAFDCHRITGLAFYPANSSLYYWPYQEALTSLQFSTDPVNALSGSGTVTTSTSGGYVHANGSGSCGSGGTCFLSTVIPGDFLIVNGCTPSLNPNLNTCPVITSVRSNTQLYLSFDPRVTTPMSWKYAGYFVNPGSATQPPSTNVVYPGGSVVVTSNTSNGATQTGSGIVWGLGSVQTACYPNGAGALYAYDPGTLTNLWATSGLNPVPFFSLTFPAFNAIAGNAAGLYAEPTIVNGNVYIPTFGINSSTDCDTSTPASGIIVLGTGSPIPPVTLACAANGGQVGAPYSSALAALGGVPPYTFSLTAGALPPGLTLSSSTGAISGTPTTAGSFSFTIQAADSTGTPAGTATSNCGIAIAPAPVTLACPANAGQVGAPYVSALAAAGGVPPYAFSFTAGSLPPGLTLNSSTGAIGGTPTGAGNFTFTAQVVDSTGAPAGTATGNCGIAIAAEPTSTTLSVTPNPAGLGQPVTLTAQVAPAPGAGKVTFYDGAAVLGSVAVAGGSASLTASLPTAAAHTLRAWYSGNPSYASSASAATALAVQARPSSTLLPAAPYLANGAGTWVVVGDFNGDGKADFVVANGGVSVWLGNGDGTFQAPVSSASEANPVAAAGDFDGDGLLDVAVVYANGVAILLGDGDGAFQAGMNYAAGSAPTAVAAADFNGDGAADLAAANAGGVSVLLGNGDGTFQEAVNYAAGAGPAAVAAGDFIGNGKADLAVVNAADGTVSVLLGNGDGTFQAAVSYAVGANPQGVALGDLNGDGRPDLVVANNAANSVSVLLGNGDGTFQAAVSYAAGANPQAVAVADVNGDGQADVVAANVGSGNIGVLLGNGDGTLQAAVSFGAGSGPVSLALADFNGDGRADIVAAGGSGSTAVVLLGGQAATSVALSASPNPSSAGQPVTFTGSVTPAAPFFGLPSGTLTFSDNGTALPSGTVSLSGGAAGYATSSLAAGAHAITSAYSGDAAFLAGTSATLTETVNVGGQTIAFGSLPNQTYGSAPFPVTATASSGLAVSFTAAGQCTVSGNTVTLTGVGSCTITANQPGNASYTAASPVSQSFTIGPEPESLTLSVPPGPVQQGQTVTLSAQLAPAPGTGATVVFYDGPTVLGFASAASGSASFTTTSLLAGPDPHALRAYFPGNANLASASSSVQPLAVSAVPSATYAAGVTYTVGVNPSGMVAGDFNLDGWPDLAVANYDTASGSTDSVSVLLNNGNGTFATAQNYKVDTGTTAVAVGDFNGDGIPDLVVVSATSKRLTVLQGKGDGTFTAGTQHFSAGSVPVRLAVADFNGDGKLDLVVVNKSSNNVSVLLGNGNLTFQNAVNYPVGTSPYAVAVGDFNDDGIADLAVSNAGSNNVTILLGKGGGTFQPGVSYPVGASPSYLAIADFNGDRKPDLAVANTNSNNLSVLLGNGDGTFQAAVNYAAGGAPIGIAAVDVNGDGNLDLATTGSSTNNLIVLLGNGNGTFQARVVFPVGSKPIPLAAADFNRDGRTDIATANWSANSVSVLLGSTTTTSTALTSSANPSTKGTAVTFKAVVQMSGTHFGTPSGTVTFADGGKALSGGTVALNGTSARFTISTLSPGTHSITAAYSGDARFGTSTSAVLSQVVN